MKQASDMLNHADHKLLETRYKLAASKFQEGNFQSAKIIANDIISKVKHSVKVHTFGDIIEPKYSIIILSHIHSVDVSNLLSSLGDYTKNDKFEVILISNGNHQLLNVGRQHLNRFTFIDIGFNYGCSGGRNIGAHYAKGQYILFIDDDGILTPNAIEELISAIEGYQAVSVRGKVVPKNTNIKVPQYDLGDHIIPSVPNAEGISIWRKDIFNKFGGFDILLAGYEGVHLCCKMFRFFGPSYFIYAPDAGLKHDYAMSETEAQKKQEKHNKNLAYLDYEAPNWKNIRKLFKRHIKKTRLPKQEHTSCDTLISAITVSHNRAQDLEDYSTSLKNQSHKNFEIIFIDNGSTDNTHETIERCWRGDDRMKFVKTEKTQYRTALEKAIDMANGEICVIAGPQQLSLPHRLQLALNCFSRHPEAGCFLFGTFNETKRPPRRIPFAPKIGNIWLRRLLNLKTPDLTLAIRTSHADLLLEDKLSGLYINELAVHDPDL